MIRSERRDGIAWVTIDRPEARNAMTFAMWDALRDLALEFDRDDDVRAVVIASSSPAAFVAGTDIAEFRGFTADDGVAYEARMEAVIAAIEAIRVPTIAAVRGACTGGGAAIAAVCDLRIGGPGTLVGVPIARTLGNCLSLKNVQRLAALIGLDAAKNLLITGRLADAAEAHALGFLSEVVASDHLIDERARAAAALLCERAPLTLRATKEMARRLAAAQPLAPDEDLIRLCYGSDDFARGVHAFLAKRRPEWTGR
jgi:enoyl-CoA hydratase/carnithine racemase